MDFHEALEDRVTDRVALLSAQLSSPDVTDRVHAVGMASPLFDQWRGDYTEPVALIGAQLTTDDDRVRERALWVLVRLFRLGAPAADQLYALATSRPDERVKQWPQGEPTLGDALKALARSGDPRAVPVLAEVLDGPTVPRQLGFTIVHLGAHAAPLAPGLRRRLAAVADDLAAADQGETRELSFEVGALLSALTVLADPEAMPEILRVLDSPDLRDQHLRAAIGALGALGPAGGDAVPVLRELLHSTSAVAAADALWSIDGDASAVLPVLLGGLASEADWRRWHAVVVLEKLGPSARDALPTLRHLSGSDDVWDRVVAARLRWRLDGDADPLLPELRSAWEEDHSRATIATCLADLGPSAAPLRDLVEQEIAEPRRYPSRRDLHSDHNIHEDEQLLATCRRALASM